MARSLGQTSRPGDDRFKDFLTKVLPNLGNHALRQSGPGVEHRHYHTQDLQTRIDAILAHLINHASQHGDALQRIILTLQRHDQSIGCRKAIEGHDAQRWGTIEQDNLEAFGLLQWLKDLPEA